MAHRITYFSMFLSIILGIICGAWHYPMVTSILFHFVFFLITILSYRIYLVIEKLGVFLYETYFEKVFKEFKKTKEKIQE
jgi:uncharacterized membrane protein YoaK (UPF0700 family)